MSAKTTGPEVRRESYRHDPKRCASAFRKFEDNREAVEEALAEQLKEVFSREDRSYHGPTHLTLRAIGRVRAENVVEELVKHIAFTLDVDTHPPGYCPTDAMLHPVAEALVAIGGQKVVTAIVTVAAEPLPERDTRACAWVLINIIGKEGAKAAIEMAEKVDRRRGKSTSRSHVIDAIDEHGLLLPVIAKPHGR